MSQQVQDLVIEGDIIANFDSALREVTESDLTMQEYLNLCKDEPLAYATAPERMLAAIGTPTIVDTSLLGRRSRIFENRVIRVYDVFKGLYGMEDAIDQIVAYFKHAAQGLEERKQILYLMGPVGSAKSSLAEKLKELMEVNPIYVLTFKDPTRENAPVEVSPIFESPLGLYNPTRFGEILESQYGIPKRYLSGIPSPWALKRLMQVKTNGWSMSCFGVRKMKPSKLEQIGVMKTEPGDENNQDISSLVGKVDIRKLERFPQNDADAYSFSGGLNRTTQGLLEFVEMFKAPIKVLHPLLTATQEGNYTGTENIPAIPFSGTILAHSNESEWLTFKNNANNVAFLDRVYIVKVPYNKRLVEEVLIYNKLLQSSALADKPCAPGTLEFLAEVVLSTRLKVHGNSSSMYSKIRVYNGENTRESDVNAKSIHEYRTAAGLDEAMTGFSTRFAYKILSRAFNQDAEEISADPISLIMALETAIEKEQLKPELETEVKAYIQGKKTRYAEFIGRELQTAYIEAYDEYGQNIFDSYVKLADDWVQKKDHKNTDTGILMNRDSIDAELKKLEQLAGISNPSDFRHEITTYVLRYRATHNGANVSWKAYEKMKEVVEKKMFSNINEILPVISFGAKPDDKTQKRHDEFVGRMLDRGYTEKSTRRLVDWYIQGRNHA